MIVTNISDFRKDIKPYFDRVTKNFETLIINRGKDSGIVISLSKHTIRWFLPIMNCHLERMRNALTRQLKN
jgi:hypothetical protein